MAQKAKVIYLDGRVEVVKILPLAQVQTEEHLSGLTNENVTRYNYHLAWGALKQAGKESQDFLTWLGLVEDADIVDGKEDDKARPTPEAQSSDTSST